MKASSNEQQGINKVAETVETVSTKRQTRRGRPKGSKNKSKQGVRALLESIVDMGEMFEKAAELARGITIQETGKNGELRVYTRAPEVAAIRLLAEYAYGRPTQYVDVPEDSETGVVLLPVPVGLLRKIPKTIDEKELQHYQGTGNDAEKKSE